MGRMLEDRSGGRGKDLPLTSAGSKIVAAFEEAIEIARDEVGPRLTARTYSVDFALVEYGPSGVRRVRDLLGMSQVVFARFLGVGPNTVRSWEQGTRPPSAIARRFMAEIEADPDHWRRRTAPPIPAAPVSFV